MHAARSTFGSALVLVRRCVSARARALIAVAAVAFAASACTGTAAPLAPSSGPWRFSGTVSTISGAPISGAEFIVVDGVNVGARATSDAGGRFVFHELESGRFTVTIGAPGFVSVTPVVDLFTDLDVNFALRSE